MTVTNNSSACAWSILPTDLQIHVLEKATDGFLDLRVPLLINLTARNMLTVVHWATFAKRFSPAYACDAIRQAEIDQWPEKTVVAQYLVEFKKEYARIQWIVRNHTPQFFVKSRSDIETAKYLRRDPHVLESYIYALIEKQEYTDVLKTLIQFSGLYDAGKIICRLNTVSAIHEPKIGEAEKLRLYQSAALVYLFRSQEIRECNLPSKYNFSIMHVSNSLRWSYRIPLNIYPSDLAKFYVGFNQKVFLTDADGTLDNVDDDEDLDDAVTTPMSEMTKYFLSQSGDVQLFKMQLPFFHALYVFTRLKWNLSDWPSLKENHNIRLCHQLERMIGVPIRRSMMQYNSFRKYVLDLISVPGINLDAKGIHGRTLMHYLKMDGFQELADALKMQGARDDIADDHGVKACSITGKKRDYGKDIDDLVEKPIQLAIAQE